jgi:hypothetical protein
MRRQFGLGLIEAFAGDESGVERKVLCESWAEYFCDWDDAESYSAGKGDGTVGISREAAAIAGPVVRSFLRAFCSSVAPKGDKDAFLPSQ